MTSTNITDCQESKDSKTVDLKAAKRLFKFLAVAAEEFLEAADGLNPSFIPCYGDSATLKKLPCKGIANVWQSVNLSIDDLRAFDGSNASKGKMEMVAVRSESDFLVIDIDSPEAKELAFAYWLPLLEPELVKKTKEGKPLPIEEPGTYMVESGREGHCALFYRMNPDHPLEFNKKFYDPNCSTLDIRVGKNYQVIAGLHPRGNLYKCNKRNIKTLTPEAVKALNEASKGITAELKPPSTVFEFDYLPSNHDLVVFQGSLYEHLNAGYYMASPENYDNWLSVGMIIHDIDPTEEGLLTWISWSKLSTRHDAFESEEACRKKWVSFGDCDNPQTAGTYYHKVALYEAQLVAAGKIETDQTTVEPVTQTTQQTKTKVTAVEEKEAVTEQEKQGYERYQEQQKKTINFDVEIIMNPFGLDEKAKKSLFIFRLQEYAECMRFPLDMFFVNWLVAYTSTLPKRYSFYIANSFAVKPILFLFVVMAANKGKGVLKYPFTSGMDQLAIEQKETYTTRVDQIKVLRANYEQLLKHDKQGAIEEALRVLGDKAEAELESYSGLPVGVEIDNPKNPPSVDQVFPLPNEPTYLIEKDVTPERIQEVASIRKDFGNMWSESEGTKQIASLNRYAAAGGETLLMIMWDGESTQRGTKTAEVKAFDWYQTSIISGLTLQVLEENFDLHNDKTGLFSRILWMTSDKSVRINHSLPEAPFDLPALFMELIRRTQDGVKPSLLPNEKGYVYADEISKKQLTAFDNFCEAESEYYTRICPGYSQWVSRLPNQVYRFCLVFHSYWFTEGIHNDLTSIDHRVVKAAIALGYVLNEHSKLLYKVGNEDIVIDKAKIYSDVLEFFLKWGHGKGVRYTDVASKNIWYRQDVKDAYCDDYTRRTNKVKKLNKAEVFKILEDMAERNYGVFDNKTGVFTPRKKK